MKVNGSKVLLTTPSRDHMVCCGYAGGVGVAAGLIGGAIFIKGHSDISHARNVQAAAFLESGMEWMLSVDTDIEFSRRDLELLYEGDELIHVAEYAKKEWPPKQPARFGMGFVLIHRDVFDVLKLLKDEHNAPMIETYQSEGGELHAYFPSLLVDGRRLSEDRSFFTLCSLAKISCRVETRTRLVHWGMRGFPYLPQVADLQPVSDVLPDAPH